jgi:hypothetical protein
LDHAAATQWAAGHIAPAHRAEEPSLIPAVAVLSRLMPSANAPLIGSPALAIWGGMWRRREEKRFIHRS